MDLGGGRGGWGWAFFSSEVVNMRLTLRHRSLMDALVDMAWGGKHPSVLHSSAQVTNVTGCCADTQGNGMNKHTEKMLKVTISVTYPKKSLLRCTGIYKWTLRALSLLHFCISPKRLSILILLNVECALFPSPKVFVRHLKEIHL